MKGSAIFRGPMSRVFYGVVLGLSLQQAPNAYAEVVGGYLDGGDRRAVLVTEESDGTRAVSAFSAAPITLGNDPRALAGKLISVSADGEFRVVPRASDRAVVIEPPRSTTTSKVVFLNARGDIIGGLGLTPADVAAIATARGAPSVRDLSTLADKTRAIALFSAVNAAGNAAASAGLRYESDRHRLVRQQLATNPLARDIVDSLRYAAVQGDELGSGESADRGVRGLVARLFGRAPSEDGASLLVGAARRANGSTVLLGQASGLVAINDNGGGGGTEGLVAINDNGGGGGTEGLVAINDNGGGGGTEGFVAINDNGGGGGTEGLVAIPLPKGLSVSCAGAMLYLY